jgi:hypothetical protein
MLLLLLLLQDGRLRRRRGSTKLMPMINTDKG